MKKSVINLTQSGNRTRHIKRKRADRDQICKSTIGKEEKNPGRNG